MSRGSKKVNWLQVINLYLDGASLTDLANKTGMSASAIRYRLKNKGILRTRKKALHLAAKQGKLGNGMRGKTRIFTQKHKQAISKARKGKGKGVSKKPNGYLEITMGKNKGKGVHRFLMEKFIGRKLKNNECVHHIDHNPLNNDIDNLQIMTRAEHSKLHAIKNNLKRNRDNLGRYTS